uniref:Ig-like domain-containing protein n=1 Tax=Calidris pygmaea TaxID=425635 RepID=A0A8C3K224_9CHAR
MAWCWELFLPRYRTLLVEAGGGLRAPGDSVLLSCRGYGFTFRNYGIWWYREAPGGSLEWMSFISQPTGNTKRYAAAVEGRATVSRDNSRSESSLSLPRDSARYFCAVRTETGNAGHLWTVSVTTGTITVLHRRIWPFHKNSFPGTASFHLLSTKFNVLFPGGVSVCFCHPTSLATLPPCSMSLLFLGTPKSLGLQHLGGHQQLQLLLLLQPPPFFCGAVLAACNLDTSPGSTSPPIPAEGSGNSHPRLLAEPGTSVQPGSFFAEWGQAGHRPGTPQAWGLTDCPWTGTLVMGHSNPSCKDHVEDGSRRSKSHLPVRHSCHGFGRIDQSE